MPDRRRWSPIAINIHISIWWWRNQVLRRIDKEPDLDRKLEMIRQLSTNMNRAYWRWRIGRKHLASDD